MALVADVMRPRAFFEILDGSLRHYRARFVPLLIPYLPQAALILLLGLLVAMMQGSMLTDPDVIDPASALGLFGVFGIFWFLYSIAYLLGFCASVFLVASQIDGEEIQPGQAWRLASGRFWPIIGTALLTTLAVGFGYLVLIIPGILLSVRLMLVFQSLLLDEVAPGDALSRSWELTRGHFWRACGFLLFLTILTMIMSGPSQITSMIPWVFLNDEGEIANRVGFYGAMAISQLLAAGVNLLVAPLTTLVFTHLYVDLRVRREGMDFDGRLRELDAKRQGA
ncbi:MAG: hypothetical protein DHS20C21_01220 [Gemmatimonadota bacterium]|nr:MAG: hypothetical protein DHS20C21_01220 [Gemmatimonadota bacterium]